MGRSVDPHRISVVFGLPMPQSWSNKLKAEKDRTPHTKRPDLDNLLKGLMDALMLEDATVHTLHAEKVWCRDEGFVILEDIRRLE